ncbi:retroviral-like aspartic protease family protein [Paracraurococcus lichenis]|uniref:Retroviral-like aspartic protease family protein n=1 Tax=Paracraurococcus lichenis TaxID=3064888 RepID=A0ABT9E058_9PROT|nr:retroviral-like aspartic protease family protein [Paracraurococcus sp. LOR1-02]MDO9709505.1 retroviral-like aspartic protease family protein [Paracraurococcus sp. LOR1-02]
MLALGVLLLAGCSGDAGGPAALCGRMPPVQVPLAEALGRPLAPARINGVPVHLLIDTGAGRSSVTAETAAGLGLRQDPGRPHWIRGTGGVLVSQTVMPETLDLAGRTLRRPPLTVHPLPGTEGAQPAVAGVLGADLMAAYEIEWDLPQRSMLLHEVQAGCPAPVPDWADARPLPLPTERRGDFFLLRAMVSGRPVLALLDSGANGSSMTTATARRLGVTEAMLAAAPRSEARGADGQPRMVSHLRFAEVRIGPEVFRGPVIGVSDLLLPPGVEMLLGLDYMRSRRFFLSHATGRAWVARPVGGRAVAISPPDAGRAAPPP